MMRRWVVLEVVAQDGFQLFGYIVGGCPRRRGINFSRTMVGRVMRWCASMTSMDACRCWNGTWRFRNAGGQCRFYWKLHGCVDDGMVWLFEIFFTEIYNKENTFSRICWIWIDRISIIFFSTKHLLLIIKYLFQISFVLINRYWLFLFTNEIK